MAIAASTSAAPAHNTRSIEPDRVARNILIGGWQWP
jgi:hypothetical protein